MHPEESPLKVRSSTMTIPVVEERDFEREVLRSELPVLVDFYADWCGPCKTMEPEVLAIHHELAGKAKVVKVNIDRAKMLAQRLQIRSVPTTMVVHQGRIGGMEVGALNRKQLRALLEPFLPRAEGALRAPELAQLLARRQAVAIDTRDAAAFGRAHVPGARNLPLEEIPARLAEIHMLPAEPVLYCRAGDQSKALAEKLASEGAPMAFLEGGFLSWESEGLPIERPD